MDKNFTLGRGRFDPSRLNNFANDFLKEDLSRGRGRVTIPNRTIELYSNSLVNLEFINDSSEEEKDTATASKENDYIFVLDNKPKNTEFESENVLLLNHSVDDRFLNSNRRSVPSKSDQNSCKNLSFKEGSQTSTKRSVIIRNSNIKFDNDKQDKNESKPQEYYKNSNKLDNKSFVANRKSEQYSLNESKSQEYCKNSNKLGNRSNSDRFDSNRKSEQFSSKSKCRDSNRRNNISWNSDSSVSSLNLSLPGYSDDSYTEGYSDNSVISGNVLDNCTNELEELTLHKHNDEYTKWWRSRHKILSSKKITEVTENLFNISDEFSLGHCVAEDMNMSAGIAIYFRKEFQNVAELLNQRQTVGGLAVLQVNDRFIYYLITKTKSNEKPTYHTMYLSLCTLRDHVRAHAVKKLAIPTIGCGLDKLDWKYVKSLIEFLFVDVDIEILVCKLSKSETEIPRRKNCKTVYVNYPIEEIEEYTIVIYLTSVDSYISEIMSNLDTKFNFIEDFLISKKQIGDVICYSKKGNYLLCGCVIQEKREDCFDFVQFQKCISIIQEKNKKLKFSYVALQAINGDKNALINRKIINILRNTLKHVEIYICGCTDTKKLDISTDNYTE